MWKAFLILSADLTGYCSILFWLCALCIGMALGPIKRLKKELQGLYKCSDPDLVLAPQEENIRLWQVL